MQHIYIIHKLIYAQILRSFIFSPPAEPALPVPELSFLLTWISWPSRSLLTR